VEKIWERVVGQEAEVTGNVEQMVFSGLFFFVDKIIALVDTDQEEFGLGIDAFDFTLPW